MDARRSGAEHESAAPPSMPTAAELRDALNRVAEKRSATSHVAPPGARSYLGPGLTPDMVDIRKVVTPAEVAMTVGAVLGGVSDPPLDEPPVYYGPNLLYRWFIFQVHGGGTLSVSLRETALDIPRYPDFLPPAIGITRGGMLRQGGGFVSPEPVAVEEANRAQPGRIVRVANVGDEAYFDRDRGLLAVRVDSVEIAFHPHVKQQPSVRDLVELAKAGVARLRHQAR